MVAREGVSSISKIARDCSLSKMKDSWDMSRPYYVQVQNSNRKREEEKTTATLNVHKHVTGCKNFLCLVCASTETFINAQLGTRIYYNVEREQATSCERTLEISTQYPSGFVQYFFQKLIINY